MRLLLFGVYASSKMFAKEEQYQIKVDDARNFATRHHTQIFIYKILQGSNHSTA